MLLYMLLYVFLKRLKSVIRRFAERNRKRHQKEIHGIPIIQGNKADKNEPRKEWVITKWVAIVGIIATLFSGILTVLLTGGSKVIPLYVTSHIVGVDVVNRGFPTGDCSKLLQVSARSTLPLPKYAISVEVGKWNQGTQDPLQRVPQDMFEIKRFERGCYILITLDLVGLINSQYAETPYGWFFLKITLADQFSTEADSHTFFFKRPYREDFANLAEAMKIHGGEFTSITGENGGLRIRNRTKRGGYVSADFVVVLDCKTNYTISGCFTVEDDDESKPCGLDFVICDEMGGVRESVILCEGQRDGYAIKTGHEKIGDEGVKERAGSASVKRSSKNEIVKNYFQIRVIEATGGHFLQLFVSQREGDFGEGTLAHNRFFANSEFHGDHTKISVRLWQAGCVELYDFQVSEEVPDLHEGVYELGN